MKQLSIALITSAMITTAPMVMADDSPHEFSANVALATDYRFRGLSQTNEDPAIQGGFDYGYSGDALPVSFYAGVWASNLDFDVADPDDADIEIDFYGGFTGEFAVGNGLAWDIGGLYYYYPGSDTGPGAADYDYAEAYGSLGYDFGPFDVKAGLNYSPDYFFESGDALYVYGDVGIPLPLGGLKLAGHVGHQDIDDNTQFGIPDYWDWKVGLSKDWKMFSFDLSYIDTDVSKSDCLGGDNICDSTAVFTVSASF